MDVRAGWMRRVALPCAVLLASAGGWAAWSDRHDPHHHRDLWIEAPELPAAELADVRGVVHTLDDRTLRGLRLRPGGELRWRLALGAEPRLRARLWQVAGCTLTVELERRDRPGAVERLLHGELQPPDADAPAYFPGGPVNLDLGPWAGREVTLRVATSAAEGACNDAWLLSPALVDRRAAERLEPEAPRPNLVLLTVDTLRADALGAWGRRPSVTPTLDALAERADVFANAFTTINNTNPSFVSLLTGLYPKNHGVFDLETRLPPERTTLIELFAQAGYITRAALAATHLGTSSGLDQGVHGLVQPWGQFYGETVANQAIHWIQSPERMEEPFFLWVHLFDPHVPHNPPMPYARGLSPARPFGLAPPDAWREHRPIGTIPLTTRPPRDLKGDPALYIDEVAYTDRQVERILAALDHAGLRDRTHVAFVADHGETLGERGAFFDHVGLHDNTTHVPLMLLPAGQRQGRHHSQLVAHFDLFPTLLRLAGLEVPTDLDARDLYADAKGRQAVYLHHAEDSGAAVRTERHLYYRNVSDPFQEPGVYFYDLAKDPGQERNLAGAGNPEEPRLAGALDRFLADRRLGVAPIPLTLSAEERAQLRSLGYLE